MNNAPKCLLSILILSMGTSFAIADDETRIVQATATMSATPENVLLAFLNNDDLEAWWKVSRSLIEQKVGGVWSVTWDDWGPDKTQHAWVGVIETITERKLVVGHLIMIEPGMPLMGPMQLEISVTPAASGSTVSISHRGYGYGAHWDSMYDAVVLGWDHVLDDMRVWYLKEY